MRCAEADARCHWMSTKPSMRNGVCNKMMYALKAINVPMVTVPSIARMPPYSSTAAAPKRGSDSTRGFHRARALVVATDAHWRRCAARARLVI